MRTTIRCRDGLGGLTSIIRIHSKEQVRGHCFLQTEANFGVINRFADDEHVRKEHKVKLLLSKQVMLLHNSVMKVRSFCVQELQGLCSKRKGEEVKDEDNREKTKTK